MSIAFSFKEKITHILNILNILKNEVVFTLALCLSVVSSFFSTPKIEYIDFRVLFTLFNLMVIVSAFKHMKILDKIAVGLLTKFDNSKKISLVLIYLTFFSSMLITNDVALITFVPLALIISKRANINPMKLVIFQTLAANIGSGLTPMGNPQNLFIFSYYNLAALDFFKIMLPFTFLGFIVNDRTSNSQSRYLSLFSLYNIISLLVFTIVNYFIFVF